MKLLKNIFRTALILLVIISCDDDRDLDFLDNVAVPSNVTAAFNITQDNTGLVTITPTADGASVFEVYYGDGSSEFASLAPGESKDRIYNEGVYDVRIVAYNIKGESTEATQQLVVSFQAPSNLVVTIENDIAISKRVNVTVTADFATMYDFYTGDPANTDPISANIGESISYDYPNPGTYALRVVAKGAAIQTTEYTEDFEVTEILAPTAGAPDPSGVSASNAISLFSDAFTDVPVDTWNTGWSQATFEDVNIDNNPTKKYTALNFNGIETVSTPVNASGMEFLHLDVWTPNMTAFRIKLVDFLGDGFQGGNGDTEAELTFTPTLGEWVSLDIPLADFANAGMTSFSDLNQYIISGDPSGAGIIFIDNVYFYGSSNPDQAAPTPTVPASNVVSLFSDAYTDVPVDTWNTGWSAATFEDVTIAGNATKKYTDLNFNGIETVANPVDASGAGATHLHLDVWTPNMTAFRIKLVDFLGDGFAGGNGDTEAELTFTPAQGQWVSLDIPLSDFANGGMTSFSDLNQYIISGDPSGQGTIFIDNVYFYSQSNAPDMAAPTPTTPSGAVISMFSDAYTDVPVDTWSTGWSAATFEDVTIAGNATKKYTNLNFNGIETVANPIDASGSTHFRMDVWTPDITAFRIKLVDFLGDGFAGGNGDTEAELTFTPTQGQWVTLDIPLSDFTNAGMTAVSDLNQLIISGDPSGAGTVFIDNVYFYNGATEPTVAAPTPTLPSANVISMFSDAYTDVPVDTWNTGWSAATFEDVTIAGNPTKKYTNLNFNGIETVANPIDASGMTHFHMDVWTPNITAFRIKLVDFLGDGFAGGNGDTEAELTFTPSASGWVSIEIPLSDFTNVGMTALSDINQLIISGDPSGQGTIFIDNVYFHN